MKKIGLIDLDYNGKFPNIPLMKLSAWHKIKGDQVYWYSPFDFYDIVYVTKVFSFTEDWKELLQQLIDSKAYVDFNQGLDIRMMTDEKAEMLSRIKIKDYDIQNEYGRTDII